jgi:hypothetical protein
VSPVQYIVTRFVSSCVGSHLPTLKRPDTTRLRQARAILVDTGRALGYFNIQLRYVIGLGTNIGLKLVRS